MNHPLSFQKLIETCLKEKQYVGLGNPAAKMLFVGKEAGIESEKINPHGTAASWNNGGYYGTCNEPDGQDKLRNKRHTWQRYQLLYEEIIKRLGGEGNKKSHYEITFVEDVFTTELNNLHAARTSDAKRLDGFKENLSRRKKVFWKSEFIQQFPITVIFASDQKYLETYPGEVCELFNVRCLGQTKIGKSSYWLHHEVEGSSSPKLLIHTRQLTNGASNALIEALAGEVVKFIENHPELRIKEQLLASSTKPQS